MTVVTFHRVLRRGDARWETALAPWTLEEAAFDQCLEFLKRHYSIVSLDDVRQALKRARPLPARSLLLTFDDGFADNLDYALPLLRKHGATATIFITSDSIGSSERLWTEDLLWAVSRGRVSQRQLTCLHTILIGCVREPQDANLIWNIVRRGPNYDAGLVELVLSTLDIDLQRVRSPRQMLRREEIATLVANGIWIGAHGKTHSAFPASSDVAVELSHPRAVLKEIITPYGQGTVDALSFPHGAYTLEIADQALSAGYELLFTGEPELCCLDQGYLATSLIGRLDADARRIAPAGQFRPEMLAASLFMAARRQPDRGSRIAARARQHATEIVRMTGYGLLAHLWRRLLDPRRSAKREAR
ncbi:polysaccharide deacetylase family protein [Bradyrhizobium sp. UFLA03-84]|uniref:polysaccharide deacetylase family protein n=1 Tax=Bradyrhizobium sp. UFLA03-84 TaxID=418599 RepID=UPI0013045168|nr:polysaccharide deacetylase family protein [Bradyrhizobium sp. UFLA03-84]